MEITTKEMKTKASRIITIFSAVSLCLLGKLNEIILCANSNNKQSITDILSGYQHRKFHTEQLKMHW